MAEMTYKIESRRAVRFYNMTISILHRLYNLEGVELAYMTKWEGVIDTLLEVVVVVKKYHDIRKTIADVHALK